MTTSSADLFEKFDIVRGLYKQEMITGPVFYKLILDIAYDFYDIGNLKEGLAVATTIPKEYYSGQFLEHLKQDADFAKKMLCLAKSLVTEGTVSIDDSSEDKLMCNLALNMGKVGKA